MTTGPVGDAWVAAVDSSPGSVDLALDALAPLAVAVRNGVVESVHHGVGVVVDRSGAVVASAGDPTVAVYLRSALKPFQTTAMVANGLDLPDRLLALATASHSGEPQHLDGAVEILELHGLGVEHLHNTPSRPLAIDERDASIRSGRPPSSLEQNCSGKHAAMLATCRINDWSLEDYLDVEHPLQQAILATMDELGVPVRHVGTDGCGAPTFVVGLLDGARGLGRMAADGSPVLAAMSAHPHMVGGTDRDGTTWMQAVAGLAAKEGAQGVMVLTLPDGRAAALKIADGTDGARQAATVEALRHLGVDVDGRYRATRDRVVVPVLGHGEAVGAFRAIAWN